MFAILLFSKIALATNISLFSLIIKTSVLRSKLSNIKAKSFLFLSVIKLEINTAMLLLNAYELIMTTNIKILILIFIVTIKILRESLLILKTSNKIRSSKGLIKRFSASWILLLKILILIKSID